MISKSAEKALRAALSKPLADFGFCECSKLRYARGHGTHADILVFPGRVENAQYKFTCNVGVRFPEIEHFLPPAGDDRATSTFVMEPIYSLCDEGYFEWHFASEDELPCVVREILAKITGSASDFLEKYRDLSAVEDAVNSPNPADWFGGRFVRVMLQAAIARHKGQVRLAQDIIDNALTERHNQKPFPRRQLEELRARLLANT